MVTLTDDHRAVLEALDAADRDVEELAEALDGVDDCEEVTERLHVLRENGLVTESDRRWTPTEDGRRYLAAPGDGSADQRIDTPEQAETMLETFQLRPDREDAVRSSYVFVRRRGETVRDEIVDAVFEEQPAGYDDPDAWWSDFVATHLASLPGIVRPDEEDEPWRYVGEHGAVGSPSEAGAARNTRADEGQKDSALEPAGPENVDEPATVEETANDESTCPVCDSRFAGRSFHLTTGTVVPARSGRSCVRAARTDEGLGLAVYYHDHG